MGSIDIQKDHSTDWVLHFNSQPVSSSSSSSSNQPHQMLPRLGKKRKSVSIGFSNRGCKMEVAGGLKALVPLEEQKRERCGLTSEWR